MFRKKKYNFDLLTEDLTMGSNNFAGSDVGQGNGISKPKKMSIPDLLKGQDDLKDRQNANPGSLPYPISTSMLDSFANSYRDINDIKSTLKQTVNNPVISTDETNRKAVKRLFAKCNKIQEIIESCGDELDALQP